MRCRTNLLRAGAALVLAGIPCSVGADTTPQALPLTQDWTNTGLITAADDWSGVPGITGYLGDDAVQGTGVDPCALTGDFNLTVDVIANQLSTGISNGGVAEFDGIANPTVALQGSGTADDPNLVLFLNTTGQGAITVAMNLRDIDATIDNAVQPIAVQYRVGNAGPWTTVSCVADATTGPSLATLVTPVGVVLPAAANNQPEVQVRIMTSNAVGVDEWVGIDDIVVTGTPSSDDCFVAHEDWGDAPECIPAYPSGILGRFPTCSSASCSAGGQELVCPAISTPPGAAPGFVLHLTPPPPASHFWLGCYPPAGGPLGGIDSEGDGKTNTPAVGSSACVVGLTTDCVETAFGGMTFDQDECYFDGVDAGVTSPIILAACQANTFPFFAANCGPDPVNVFLNVLVDMNEDGDWNDNVQCAGSPTCAYEWAVKNLTLTLPPGCSVIPTPAFAVGPLADRGWLRLSLSPTPAPDDYPWSGAIFQGGETEDYPVAIDRTTPANPSSWGRVKSQYR